MGWNPKIKKRAGGRETFLWSPSNARFSMQATQLLSSAKPGFAVKEEDGKEVAREENTRDND